MHVGLSLIISLIPSDPLKDCGSLPHHQALLVGRSKSGKGKEKVKVGLAISARTSTKVLAVGGQRASAQILEEL